MGRKKKETQIEAANKERSKKIYTADELLQKGRFSLTLTEQRFIIYVISKIKPKDEVFEKYTFKLSDFQRVCGIYEDESYTKLKRILLDLKSKNWWLLIDDPDAPGKKCESLVSWFEVVRISKNIGKITVKFNEDMMPFLLKLAKNREEGKGYFTFYEFRYILPMRSQYSIRLYQLLKPYQKNNNEWYFKLDELKRLLDCKSYKRYHDFKRFAIEPAVREINKFSDLVISYEVDKDGKKVDTVIFYMREKSMDEKLEAQREGLTQMDGQVHWWDGGSNEIFGQMDILDLKE